MKPKQFSKRVMRDLYEVGPFRIIIFEDIHEPGALCSSLEYIYHVLDITHNDPPLKHLVDLICKRITPDTKLLETSSLDLLLNQVMEKATCELDKVEAKIAENIKRKVCELATFKYLKLDAFAPFLLDDNVCEFYLDGVGEPIYVDHEKWGRCVSTITPTLDDVESLITHVRLDSGFRLDKNKPSLKTEVKTRMFHLRVSIDSEPLVMKKYHLDVRKVKRKVFTLPVLVSNGTLSSEIAAYLYLCLIFKRNISIIGEPAAGKSTLLNSLDMLTPLHWRKIYVEDVIESADLSQYGMHQVKLKVEPFEECVRKSTKEMELVKMLHRSPDYIYFGEIQTDEHSRALFQALSAGLRGFHTFHANDPMAAIIRWHYYHKIPLTSISMIDLFVLIKRLQKGFLVVRRVAKIYETYISSFSNSIDSIEVFESFSWNLREDRHVRNFSSISETPVMKKIRDEYHIDEDSLETLFMLLQEVFEIIVKAEIFDVKSVIRIFNDFYTIFVHNIDKLTRMSVYDLKYSVKELLKGYV